jgi:hypothetical protein
VPDDLAVADQHDGDAQLASRGHGSLDDGVGGVVAAHRIKRNGLHAGKGPGSAVRDGNRFLFPGDLDHLTPAILAAVRASAVALRGLAAGGAGHVLRNHESVVRSAFVSLLMRGSSFG